MNNLFMNTIVNSLIDVSLSSLLALHTLLATVVIDMQRTCS
jgi:hypothetical protein